MGNAGEWLLPPWNCLGYNKTACSLQGRRKRVHKQCRCAQTGGETVKSTIQMETKTLSLESRSYTFMKHVSSKA